MLEKTISFIRKSPNDGRMKKKPHQRQSAINNVFSDFRARLYEPNQSSGDERYEVIKHKNGYTVRIHRERGANEDLAFETKQALDAYLKSLS